MGSEITTHKLSAKEMDAEIELAKKDHLDAQNSAINAVEKAISCGSRLVKIKESCAHGEFMPRIKAIGMGQRTANRYMQAYRNKEALLENGLDNLLDQMSVRDLSGRFVDGNPGGPVRGSKGEHPVIDVKEGRFVYAITNPMIDGWTKIGESENPQIRLSQFHTYAPDDYVLAEYRKLPDGISDKLIHPFIHLRYERKREWFKCSPQEAMEVVDLLIEDADELAPNASRKQLEENVIDRNI
jgi:hypothetical protein